MTRARTLHEEHRAQCQRELLAQRSCWGVLATIAISVFLPLYQGAAALLQAPATVAAPAIAAEGYDADAQTYWREVNLDGAYFAEPLPPGVVSYMQAAGCEDYSEPLLILLTGMSTAARMGYSVPEPLLLACLARYESGFDDTDIGSAGERGLLQIHPCHKTAMRKMGLDFTDSADRVAYGCILYAQRGLQPWSVRAKAQRDYKQHGGE